MKAKQAIKENRVTHEQTKMLERCDKLKAVLVDATPDQLIQFAPEAHKLIEDVRKFNSELAQELEDTYNSREAEVLKA